MTEFKAFRIHDEDGAVRAGFERMSVGELTDGEVVIKVSHSSINYKDALAATGKGKILRRSPLNGGIDLAGVVESSTVAGFAQGDRVLACGAGLSENLDGGYAHYARLPESAVVRTPDALSDHQAMAIGTAGFTMAIGISRMEDNGQTPDMGPIVVTGATGGVGSFAIDLLSGLGYEVIAFTGKKEQEPYLRSIGVSDLIDRHSVEMGSRPLEQARWGGAVDNVGGDALAWLTRTIKPWGNIAAIGLAGGHKLETTVMPFILRGVSLLGINSIVMPTAVRDRAWERLGTDLKPRHLDKIVQKTIDFDALPKAFDDFIAGRIVGRTVVKIAD